MTIHHEDRHCSDTKLIGSPQVIDKISQSTLRNFDYRLRKEKKNNIGLFERAFSPKTSSEFSIYFSLIFHLFLYLLGFSSIRCNHVGCYSPPTEFDPSALVSYSLAAPASPFFFFFNAFGKTYESGALTWP